MLSEESTVSSERLRVSRRKQMKPQHKVEGCKDGKETNESMSSDASGGTESSSSSGDGKLPHPSTTTTTPTLTGIITPHGGIIHTQTAATCSNETSDQQAYKTEKNNPIDLNTRSLSASNNTTHPMVSCINPMTDLTQHGEANCMEPVVSQSMKRSVSDHGSEGMRSTENERMNSYHQSDMETDQEMNETDAVATAVSMSGSNQHFSDSDLMESGKELLAGKTLERCNYSPRNRDKDQEEKESFNDSLNPRLLKEISQSIASNQTKSQSKNSNIENESLRNEMNEMKDQLRIIQHQYMYQAQRIQYLNLQVSLLAASHHQGALQNREQQCQTPPLPRSSSTNSNITIDKNIADHSSQIGSRNITSKLQDFILAAAAQQGYSGTGVGGMTSQSNQPSAYGGGASVVDRVTKSTFPCIPASMMQQNKFLFHNEFANEARNGERAQECKSCSHVFKNESALQAHLISGTCQDGPTQQNFISLAACSNQNLSTDEAVDKHERGGIGTEIEAEMRGLNHGGRDSLVLQSNFKNDEDSDQHLMSHKLLPTHRKSEESSDGGAASADKEDMDNDNFISTVFQNSISKNPLPGLSALRSMNFGRRVGAASSGSELMSTSETFKLQELVEQIDKKKSLDKNECEICHRVLSCQSALKLHHRAHTGERPYKCDICSRDFPTRGYLRTHYSSVHRSQMVAASCSPVAPNLNSATGTTIASGLECKLCRNRFPDQQALQQHMQLHMLFSNQNQHQQQHEQVAQLFQKYNAAEEGKRPHHGVGYSSNSLFSMDFVKQRPSPTTSTATAAVTEQSVGSMYHNLLSNTENSDCMSPQSSSAGEPSISNSKDAAANPSDLVDYQSENKLDKSTPLENQLEKVTAAAAGFDETTKKSDENDDLCPNQIALDLTRPNPKESDEAGTSLQSVSDPVKCENSSFTPTFLASNSLSALAQLASNSSLMRHDRLLPSHQLEFQSSSMQNEEVRNRKLAIACDICSKPFSCQSALDIHLRSHTKERPYKCRVCDRGFTTKGNLKQHLLTHNMTEVEDKMLDPVCSPKSFNQNLSVTGEQQKKTYVVGEKRHLENNGSQTAPDAKKNYPRHWCHVCQKQFSSASSLQIHNRTHTGEKPFACSVCGRAFTTKGNLKVHMGTHVWGAGGSRRGRRISMDNPLISPWMQNTAVTASSSHTPTNPQSLIRFPGPLADRAMFYQQYAALASRNFGVKPLYAGFNSLLPLGNTATSRLLMNSNNGQVNPLAPTSESVPTFNPNLLRPENSNKLAAQLIWKVCQRAQEQVN